MAETESMQEAAMPTIAEQIDVILGAATNLESTHPQQWSPSWVERLRAVATEIQENCDFSNKEASDLHELMDGVRVPHQHEWTAGLPLMERIFHPRAMDTDLVWRVRVLVEWVRMVQNGETPPPFSPPNAEPSDG